MTMQFHSNLLNDYIELNWQDSMSTMRLWGLFTVNTVNIMDIAIFWSLQLVISIILFFYTFHWASPLFHCTSCRPMWMWQINFLNLWPSHHSIYKSILDSKLFQILNPSLTEIMGTRSHVLQLMGWAADPGFWLTWRFYLPTYLLPY